jgi:hypothetical protein
MSWMPNTELLYRNNFSPRLQLPIVIPQNIGFVMRVISIVLLGVAGFTSWPALAECVAVKYRDTPVCLDTFKCTKTAQSSFVREVCFDVAKSYMLIKLNDTWYQYCSVDRVAFENLINAPSVGRYYNESFRSHGPVHGPFDCRDHPVPDYP